MLLRLSYLGQLIVGCRAALGRADRQRPEHRIHEVEQDVERQSSHNETRRHPQRSDPSRLDRRCRLLGFCGLKQSSILEQARRWRRLDPDGQAGAPGEARVGRAAWVAPSGWPPGRRDRGTRRHRFREVSVRRLYPGTHRIDIQVNGRILAGADVELTDR